MNSKWNNRSYRPYTYYKSAQDEEADRETTIDYLKLENALCKLCPELDKEELFQVTQETAFRMASLAYDELYQHGIMPEVYYAVTTADFLHDKNFISEGIEHSVNELLNLEDDGAYFDYTPSLEDERCKEYAKELLVFGENGELPYHDRHEAENLYCILYYNFIDASESHIAWRVMSQIDEWTEEEVIDKCTDLISSIMEQEKLTKDEFFKNYQFPESVKPAVDKIMENFEKTEPDLEKE